MKTTNEQCERKGLCTMQTLEQRAQWRYEWSGKSTFSDFGSMSFWPNRPPPSYPSRRGLKSEYNIAYIPRHFTGSDLAEMIEMNGDWNWWGSDEAVDIRIGNDRLSVHVVVVGMGCDPSFFRKSRAESEYPDDPRHGDDGAAFGDIHDAAQNRIGMDRLRVNIGGVDVGCDPCFWRKWAADDECHDPISQFPSIWRRSRRHGEAMLQPSNQPRKPQQDLQSSKGVV